MILKKSVAVDHLKKKTKNKKNTNALYLEYNSFGLPLIAPLDGIICGIDQRNLRYIESGGVTTDDTFLRCKKFGVSGAWFTKRE